MPRLRFHRAVTAAIVAATCLLAPLSSWAQGHPGRKSHVDNPGQTPMKDGLKQHVDNPGQLAPVGPVAPAPSPSGSPGRTLDPNG
jgi:hypothetical protein